MSLSPRYLYYADYFAGTIGRISLNTKADETLRSGLHSPKSVRFDGATGNLYFVEFGSEAKLYKDGTLQVFPHVELNNACPYPATAIAQLVNGFVVGASITDSGCGYTNTPGVSITGGGGGGAQAVAVVSNGMVTAINVLDVGSDYTNTPAVVIAPPILPQPSIATANASVVNGFVVGVTISDAGFGYTNAPIVRVIGGGGTGAHAVAW
jgi:hypothetical protein